MRRGNSIRVTIVSLCALTHCTPNADSMVYMNRNLEEQPMLDLTPPFFLLEAHPSREHHSPHVLCRGKKGREKGKLLPSIARNYMLPDSWVQNYKFMWPMNLIFPQKMERLLRIWNPKLILFQNICLLEVAESSPFFFIKENKFKSQVWVNLRPT